MSTVSQPIVQHKHLIKENDKKFKQLLDQKVVDSGGNGGQRKR